MEWLKTPLVLSLALLVGGIVAVSRSPESTDRSPVAAGEKGFRSGGWIRGNAGGGLTDEGEGGSATAGRIAWQPVRELRPGLEEEAASLSPAELAARKLAALDEVLAAIDANPNLTREQGDALARYAGQLATEATPRFQCWALDTPPQVVQAYLMAEQKIVAAGDFAVQALRVANHWSRTATNGNGQNTQGQPVTLTWSIVPDGTPISASSASDSADPSSLRDRLAVIYGGSATGVPAEQPWFPVFQAVFDNIAAVSGVRFVYEPNDDGAVIDSTSGTSDWGVIGVRGDIRFSGHAIDGDSGTLAYAYYPDNGDVVIDTADSYYNTISNNSIRLRNILEHEIGHSLGLAHVCPVNQTKLMEPFVTTAFRGSQFDDIYSHQRNYGDPLEVHGSLRNNDTPANATVLAPAPGTTAAWQWLGIDDSTDSDHFKIAATRSQQVTARVIPSDPIQPASATVNTYLEGAQNSDGSCSAGTAFDPTNRHDLVLDLLGPDGTTVVATAPAQPAGATEAITGFQFPADGSYTLRVRGGSGDTAQLYRLEVLLEAAPVAPLLVLSAAPRLDAESNDGANGVPDPGETVRYGFRVRNDGQLAASGVSVALSTPAGGTIFTAPAQPGDLAPGAEVELLHTFALAGVPGETIPLSLVVTADGYASELPFTLTLGGIGTINTLAGGNFDAAPGLPAGWTTSTTINGIPWTVSSAQSFSPANAAFGSQPTIGMGDSFLVSPTVTIGAAGGELSFRHSYSLENRWDGGVLEASRNGGAWFDLITGGGTLLAGGYNNTIRGSSSAPINGRSAWTHTSGGFIHTRVGLPAAWAGESIAFRWRISHDLSTVGTGWYVDDIQLPMPGPIADPFLPRLSLTSLSTSVAEGEALEVTVSTPLPLAQAVPVTLEITGSATPADLDGAPSLILPAGQTSVTVPLTVTRDGLAEGPETLVLSLPTGTSLFAPTAPSSVAFSISDALSAYATWISAHAAPGSPEAASTADLDGDGTDNAGEFAFGSDPSDPASLPRFETALTAATFQLLLPGPLPDGVTVGAETSAGLDGWTTAGVQAIPGGFEVPHDGERRFLRLVYQVVE